MKTLRHTIAPEEEGRMVKQIARGAMGASHRLFSQVKFAGGVLLDGERALANARVRAGQVLELRLAEEAAPEADATHPAGAVNIVYEDEDLLVLNKPAGMPVHPSQGHHGDTLGNVFAAQFPQLPFRPVYRLDSDTSGICLVAKSAYAAGQLQGSTRKTYLALVCGKLSTGGTVDAPIGRAEGSVLCRCVRPEGKPAVTHYTPLRSDGTYTLLSLRLETGRTHQIRVHMAYLGYPLAGDRLYGSSSEQFPHHMLHCDSLEFSDPETGECRQFSAACPWNSCM